MTTEQTSLTLKPKKQFKKDLKRLEGNPKKLKAIQDVINLLKSGDQLTPEYRPHPLVGNWVPHMECHVLPDLLLIWTVDRTRGELILTRCGTHSELF